jgi:hypothetical protein
VAAGWRFARLAAVKVRTQVDARLEDVVALVTPRRATLHTLHYHGPCGAGAFAGRDFPALRELSLREHAAGGRATLGIGGPLADEALAACPGLLRLDFALACAAHDGGEVGARGAGSAACAALLQRAPTTLQQASFCRHPPGPAAILRAAVARLPLLQRVCVRESAAADRGVWTEALRACGLARCAVEFAA